MKRKFLLFAILGLLGVCHAADNFPSPDSIKTDLVLAVKSGKDVSLRCYVVRENYYQADVKKTANDQSIQKIPRSAIRFVFYKNADNESYIDGLKAYENHQYKEALGYFNEALASLKDFKVLSRKESFSQNLYYYIAMTQMNMGDNAAATKSFDLCLQPKDAIYSFQAEYYRARCLENMGEYAKAVNRYKLLINAVYPKLMKKASWGGKWNYLCQLGLQRAMMLQSTQRPGQESNVSNALKKFEELINKNKDKLTQEMKDDALMVRINANKYLAQKDPAKYADVIQSLAEPVRNAIADNNKKALNWMYPALADSYYGQMQAATDEAKKKELAQMALFEYMRVCLVSNAAPKDLCTAYYHSGKLFEYIKVQDWQKRALQQYKRAARPTYKKFQDYVKALEAVKRLTDEQKDEK